MDSDNGSLVLWDVGYYEIGYANTEYDSDSDRERRRKRRRVRMAAHDDDSEDPYVVQVTRSTKSADSLISNHVLQAWPAPGRAIPGSVASSAS